MSLISAFEFKSIFSEINTGTPALFGFHLHGIFFPSLHFEPMCISEAEVCVFYASRSCVLVFIHASTLCLFIGKFTFTINLFSFKVITGR